MFTSSPNDQRTITKEQSQHPLYVASGPESKRATLVLVPCAGVSIARRAWKERKARQNHPERGMLCEAAANAHTLQAGKCTAKLPRLSLAKLSHQ